MRRRVCIISQTHEAVQEEKKIPSKELIKSVILMNRK